MPSIKLANGQAVQDIRVWDGLKWVSREGKVFTEKGWEYFFKPAPNFIDNFTNRTGVILQNARALIKKENLVKNVTDESFWNEAPAVKGMIWGFRNTYDPSEDALKVSSYASAHNGHSFYLIIERDKEFTLQADIKTVKDVLYGSLYLVLYDANGEVLKSNYVPNLVGNHNWGGIKSPESYKRVAVTFKIPTGDFPTAVKYTIQLVSNGSAASEIYLKNIWLEEGNIQNVFSVSNTANFQVGQQISITDGINTEYARITAVGVNSLTVTPLINTYPPNSIVARTTAVLTAAGTAFDARQVYTINIT